MKPRMSANEIELFMRHLRQSSFYLEFGCGGSTVMALQNCDRVFSVEGDPDWIAQLRSRPEVAAAEGQGRLRLHHADIGPVGKWGHPANRNDRVKWPGYSTAPWSLLDYEPDIILVDGRFRAACVAQSLLKASPSCKIAIHDVSPDRPSYIEAIELLDVVDRVDTLVIGTRKKRTTESDILDLFERYMANPT